MDRFDVAFLGDAGLLLRYRTDSSEASDTVVDFLLAARDSIEAAAIPGMLEAVIGFASVAVFFDPVVVAGAGAPLDEISPWFAAQLQMALAAGRAKSAAVSSRAAIEIPVCYDPEFALDLDRVARHTGLPQAEVIRLHSEADYRVRCVGFTPGFPYLSGLPTELATPRRATPRTNVPAGAVAIGGNQAGIYPARSPGGWNVIGRTPLKLFDPHVEPPAVLHAGQQLRFRAITRAEFATAL